MSQLDEHGYDNIYDKNISNIYLGKEMIERFKGASLADLFQSMPEVYTMVKPAIAQQSVLIFVAFREKDESL
ncbi:MAG: hypothetical protein ACL7BU_10865 [Candidatus Phlomobacter fragariae]